MPVNSYQDELMAASLLTVFGMRRRERALASRLAYNDLQTDEVLTLRALREALKRRGKNPTPGLRARLANRFGRTPAHARKVDVLP
jgi:hypothetical protein